MEILNLVKCRDSDVVYSRTTAKKTLDNVIIKIKVCIVFNSIR